MPDRRQTAVLPGRAQDVGSARLSLPLVLACAAMVFAIALGLRMGYQASSQVDDPLRADSGRYFTAAFNFYFHGVHSLDRPSFSRTPRGRTDLAPGYPLFLTTFFADPLKPPEIVKRVGRTQAVIGATSAVLAMLLALTALPLAWAMLAGLLTAFSPHLIVMNQLLLTETVFTFMVLLGVLLSTLAWQRRSAMLAAAGVLLLGLSGEVRTIGFVLPLVPLALFYFAPARSRGQPRRLQLMLASMIALLLVGAAHWSYQKVAVLGGPFGASPEPEFVDVRSPVDYLTRSLRPPNFVVEGHSHALADNLNPEWKNLTQKSFREETGAYLRWNGWGRWVWMWHFDSAYSGNVYVYPMPRAGFTENSLLGLVHDGMHALHWPLYALAWLGAATVLLRQLRGRGSALDRDGSLLIAAGGFAAFLFALSLVAWLPRYTIPMRPLSYVLAVAAVYWMYRRLRGITDGPSRESG